MSDLVARLRSGEDGLEYAAADELDALRVENARLRDALDTIGFAPSGWSGPNLDECILIARAALKVKP
jgi:hypothetical protein